MAKALMQLSSTLMHHLVGQPVTEYVPTVTHRKRPGGGYTPGSALYRKQQAMRSLDVKVVQPQPSVPVPTVADIRSGGLRPVPVPSDSYAPLSTSLRCIVDLVAQFFIVYTILFVLQALNTMDWLKRERETKAMTSVATTVYFVPMLCILFLAVRMRALQLSQGQPELYDLPPWWVKSAMVVCTWSVAALTILVFFCTVLYGDMWEAQARSQGMNKPSKVLFVLHTACQALIYVCFVVICVGLCAMQPPEELWGKAGGPPVSPAVTCTIFLSTIYFMVYIALAVSRASNEAGLLGPPQRFRPTQELLKTATLTVAFVPMLCVLFIAVRMRSLQFDPIHGNPPRWVQAAFYICTLSLLVQAVLALFGTSTQDAVVHEGGTYADVSREPEVPRSSDSLSAATSRDDRSFAAKALGWARMLATFTLNAGVAIAIVGMFVVPENKAASELPLVLYCVVHLTALYFIVYFLFTTLLSMKHLNPNPRGRQENDPLAALGYFLEYRGREAVRFCPIFCILYLATLMRALHITQGAGAPPKWTQDLARVATWGITGLTIARFDTLIRKPPQILVQVCHAFQYVCLFMLYCSAIGMVVSLYTMTPAEALTGPGAMSTTTALNVASNSLKHPFHTVQSLRPAHPALWHW